MGHSSGNSQLLMSLALVTVGTGLFLGGLGTKHWLHYTSPDHANTTMSCGLWETCVEERDASASQSSGGCSGIKPGSAKAYFEATRTVESVALAVYVLTLCTCCVADDRDPSQSAVVCLRRYIHAVFAFVAGGLTFVAIVVFVSCYKDDDWFVNPELNYSFWLTLAAFLCTIAGAFMRVVFISWPDRPSPPPAVPQPKKAPKAPGRRKARVRVDHELGAEPLPHHLRPPAPGEKGDKSHGSDRATPKKPGGFRRFFSFFRRKKTKPAVADISTVCETLRDKHAHGDASASVGADNHNTGEARKQSSTADIANGAANPGNTKTPTNKPHEGQEEGQAADSSSGDESLNMAQSRRRRRHGRRGRQDPTPLKHPKHKRRARKTEAFVGYNIPPTPGPGPILSDMGDSSPESETEAEVDKADGASRRGIKRYERVVDADDLRSRAMSSPPAVVHPPTPEHGGVTQQHLSAN